MLVFVFVHRMLVKYCGLSEPVGWPVATRKSASPTPHSEAERRAFVAAQERAAGGQRSVQPT